MSVRSAPFYWLVCDAEDCGYESSEDSDYVAWIDIQNASDAAVDTGWIITEDGRHYCSEHTVNVCTECGAYDAAPYSGERDYLCRPCAAKDGNAA